MTSPDPQQGDVWHVTLNPTKGNEIGKTRPCVVISSKEVGRLALRMIVPITEWRDHYVAYPWMVRLDPDEDNGLAMDSAADCFQARSVSLTRFKTKLGSLPDERVDRISKAISLCVRTPRT